jgi:hypothetical protein
MEKIFEVVLKDDEVLVVSFGEEIQGIIIRPTIEKVIKLCSLDSYDRIEDVIKEYVNQDSDIVIGVNDFENNRIMKATFTVSFATQLKNEELVRIGYENFNLEIIKILI